MVFCTRHTSPAMFFTSWPGSPCRIIVFRRYRDDHECLGTRETTFAGAAAKAGSWSHPHALAAQPRSSADFGEAVGSGSTVVGLEEHRLAAGWSGTLRSRFAAVRVRPAHRDEKRTEPRPEEWLLIEWPKEASEQNTNLAFVIPA